MRRTRIGRCGVRQSNWLVMIPLYDRFGDELEEEKDTQIRSTIYYTSSVCTDMIKDMKTLSQCTTTRMR